METAGHSRDRPQTLLAAVRASLRAKHYSPRTEEAYVGWIRRFIRFHGRRHSREMGETEVVTFFSSLAVDGHVAASTQNQALSALIFLYGDVLNVELDWLQGLGRAKRPERFPVVLTRDEVARLLSELNGTGWLMASLMHGAGLRLLECAELRIKDLDLTAREIRVRDVTRVLHGRDIAAGAGWVSLPDALGRKFPRAGREIAWQWLFPATGMYVDRETGQHRRHHLHESVLQRAVKAAVERADTDDSGTAWASRREHDDDLYPRVEQGRARREEPS